MSQLRKRRQALGMSLTETAKAAGISRTTLENAELGHNTLGVLAIIRVARALGDEGTASSLETALAAYRHPRT